MDKTGKRIIIHLSDDDRNDIRCMFSKGKCSTEIAEYIGCSRSTVYYHLRKMKLIGVFKWTIDLDNAVINHCHAKLSRKEISSIIGVPVKRVSHRIGYLRKLGKLY